MPTTKTNVITIGSEGERAYERVRPFLEEAKKTVTKAVLAIAEEFQKIKAETEKRVFCDKLGWSRNRVSEFVTAAKRLPEKQRVLGLDASSRIYDFDIQHLVEIGKTPNKTLKAAVAAGMFDVDKTVRVGDIRRLRNTGQIPQEQTKPASKTDFQKIKSLMDRAETHIRKASLNIAEITAIMEGAGITNAKGKEATALIKSFEKLCTKMATANPETSKRAFQILRGEV